jgi:hypothetical protein
VTAEKDLKKVQQREQQMLEKLAEARARRARAMERLALARARVLQAEKRFQATGGHPPSAREASSDEPASDIAPPAQGETPPAPSLALTRREVEPSETEQHAESKAEAPAETQTSGEQKAGAADTTVRLPIVRRRRSREGQ